MQIGFQDALTDPEPLSRAYRYAASALTGRSHTDTRQRNNPDKRRSPFSLSFAAVPLFSHVAHEKDTTF